MAPLGRMSRQPSPYPRLLFHLIRVAQLVTSSIVLAFLAFFVHYLVQDHYYIPWTFLVLLGVAGFTDLSVIVTAYFYHYRELKPRLSSFINAGLTAIWIAGFVLLTLNLSYTLSNTCNVDNWDHETGIMVCRIYKAIEAFTVAAMLLTASSFLLDLFTIRKGRSRGAYNQMGGDVKRPINGQRSRGISNNDDFSTRDHEGEESLTANYREPSLEFPEYSHEARKPYKPQKELQAERFGYSGPNEQTSYGGAGARELDRQFDEMGA